MHNFKSILLSFSFLLIFNLSFSQNTLGNISISNGVEEGLTLFSVHKKTFLINNCGQVVKEWTSNFPPGNSVYLLEDGRLLRAGKSSANETIDFPGTGGVIEIYSWEGSLEWQYFYESDDYKQHHDVYPMPNGNILILAATPITSNEAIDAGRDPNLLSEGLLFNEQVVEITPSGTNDATIVWEWNIKDHFIQDFDDTKSNYGIVADHPERLDINFLNGGSGGANWLHINSMQYDENLDQIILSSRNLSEIWIIDHSTSTAEAATSSGGNYGKGGDILYRWGNQQSYKQGDENDRKLFGQHYPHIIKQGLPNQGKMLVFNNGNGRTPTFSEVFMFQLPESSSGDYTLNNSGTYDPITPDFIYDGTSINNTPFYSAIVSGAQQLPGGNILICEGRSGEIFEIDSNNEIVWEYINPVSNTDGIISNQGEVPTNENLTFRAIKYPLNFSGFVNRDLTPGNPIEGNWNLNPCTALSNEDISLLDFKVYPNPLTNQLNFHSKSSIETIEIYSLLGSKIAEFKNPSSSIDISILKQGIYMLRITDSSKKTIYKKVIKD